MGLVLDNNLLLSQEDETTFPQRLGINNLYRAAGATVTASAEDTANDGHKENAYKEGFTHDFWKPGSSGSHWLAVSLGSSATADYVAVAAHDLNQHAGSIKAQYSTDGGMSWNDAHSAVTPGTSQPVMILFTAVDAADWRLFISSTGAVSIGAVHIGGVLKMPGTLAAPWSPPYLRRDVRYVNDRTEGGAFVGRSIISKGAEFPLQFQGVELDWIRNTWEPLVRSIEQYPFFFTARDVAASGLSESEVVYAWTTRQPRSSYVSNVHGDIQLQCRGLID